MEISPQLGSFADTKFKKGACSFFSLCKPLFSPFLSYFTDFPNPVEAGEERVGKGKQGGNKTLLF